MSEGRVTRNSELLHADALEFLKREPRDWSDWKLVANLPYSVASPILVELASGARAPKRMVATLQLEVAQRLMAKAGDKDYGVLTLLVQLDYEPRDWFKIPAELLFPGAGRGFGLRGSGSPHRRRFCRKTSARLL